MAALPFCFLLSYSKSRISAASRRDGDILFILPPNAILFPLPFGCDMPKNGMISSIPSSWCLLLANRDIMSSTNAGDSFLFSQVGKTDHCFYFFLRDGTFVNYFFSDKTIGSVHGYITCRNQVRFHHIRLADRNMMSGTKMQITPFSQKAAIASMVPGYGFIN